MRTLVEKFPLGYEGYAGANRSMPSVAPPAEKPKMLFGDGLMELPGAVTLSNR